MRKTYLLLFSLLFIACKSSQPVPITVQELPVPAKITVLEPQFEVLSIYIIQADLVVTEFEAVIKVDNPNSFASDLSAIKYDLYGNNFHWAEGIENDILHVPANSSSETKFRFSMNFINTNRKLLDDVIAMRQVKYRFKGQAEVKPDIPKVSAFNVNFDCSGLSDVKRKAED